MTTGDRGASLGASNRRSISDEGQETLCRMRSGKGVTATKKHGSKINEQAQHPA